MEQGGQSVSRLAQLGKGVKYGGFPLTRGAS